MVKGKSDEGQMVTDLVRVRNRVRTNSRVSIDQVLMDRMGYQMKNMSSR
jgi:hypothetical protein